MSSQPPHRWESRIRHTAEKYRLRSLAVAACLVLAGCATQGEPDKTAGLTDETLMLIGDRSHRDQYLAGVRSDPLGAYLSASDKVSRPQTHPRGLATTALTYLGINYRFGGDTPTRGFDCSGLVKYAAEKSLGLKLPRRSAEMARLGESVKRNDLERGDLVFFNTRGQRFSHVGIYLGEGKFVHAPSTGSKVRVESMNIGYWKKRYNGARRLASGTGTGLRVAGNETADIQKLATK